MDLLIPNIYTYLLRYTLFGFGTLFLYKTIAVLIDSKISRIKTGYTAAGMCFFTACYCFSIFTTTFKISEGLADNLMPFNFVAGFSAYYFYILAIQRHCKIKSKLLKFAQSLILLTAVLHLISLIKIYVTGTPLLTDYPATPVTNLYFITCGLRKTANMAGNMVGLFGGVGIFISLAIIIKQLLLFHKEEKLLFYGSIITLVASLNDTMLGLGQMKYGFPIYFLGNGLEAIRFSNYIKIKTIDTISSLKRDISQSTKLATLGTLAAGVGHEINNPLTIIVNYGNLIKRELVKANIKSETIDKGWSVIDGSLRRIGVIVNGLKSSVDHDSDASEAIDLNECIKDTLEFVSVIFEMDDAKIETEIANESIVVEGCQSKFQQVVVNLLSNARDALASNDQKIISISTKKEGERALLTISDNGCGIEQDKIDSIFDTFYTTKEVGKGTGLGLSIVYNIIKSMNGKISTESIIGKGTTFSVSLPLSTKHISNISKEEIDPSLSTTKTILIVDDEEDIRFLLQDTFEGHGLKVESAADGIEALEKINKTSFDYILTDMKMPNMNGAELIKKLEGHQNFKGDVFVLTGSIQNSSLNIEGHVVKDVIFKPIDFDRIYKKVCS